MALGTISDYLGVVGIGAILTAVISSWFNYLLKKREFEREQQISYLKERLDNFYSPMLFHFENMRSWAKFRNAPQSYVWADPTLVGKIGDMVNVMRSGLRFASAQVQELWYVWQPLAVGAVDKIYPEYTLADMLSSTQQLHDALIADRDSLMEQYRRAIGHGS